MSNPFAQTDSSDQSLKSPEVAQSRDLSAKLWEDLKQVFSKSAGNSGSNDVLDFKDDIYGCPAGPEDLKSKRELSPRYGTELHDSMGVKDFADKYFDQIDKDHDGSMTHDELEAAKKELNLNGDQMVAMDLLIENQQRFADLSNDEFGAEDDGITRDDLKEFGKVIQECEAGERVAYESLDFRFKEADLDHDGYLSREEIDKRIEVLEADPTHSYTHLREQVESLKEIRSRYDEIKDAAPAEDGDKGVSVKDMGYYAVSKKPLLMYNVEGRVEKHVKEVVSPREIKRLSSMWK